MVKYKFSNASTYDVANNGIYYFYNHSSYPELHSHTFWEITVIMSGEVMHKINKEKIRLSKGSLLLVRPSDEHALLSIPGKDHSHVNIIVNCAMMESQLRFFGDDIFESIMAMPNCTFSVSEHILNKISDAIAHLQMMDAHDTQYVRRLKLLFLDLLREIFSYQIKQVEKAALKYPPVLEEMLDKMYDRNNFTKSVEELCSEANYSHAHIIRLFKQYTDTTPVKLFNSIKLNYARNLLESTNSSVIFIANEIGYSLSPFNIAFKKLFRCTPSQYRKRYTASLEI